MGKYELIFLVSLFICSQPSLAGWEVTQTISQSQDDDKSSAKVFHRIVRLEKRRLYQITWPDGSKETDAGAKISVFDGIHAYRCEREKTGGTCQKFKIDVFNPFMVWSKSYNQTITLSTLKLTAVEKTKAVGEYTAECFKKRMYYTVESSAGKSNLIKSKSQACYATAISFKTVIKHMYRMMRNLGQIVKENDSSIYRDIMELGVPLFHVEYVIQNGSGPYGVGKTKFVTRTKSVEKKKLQLVDLARPKDFKLMDFTDHLKDVQIKLRK